MTLMQCRAVIVGLALASAAGVSESSQSKPGEKVFARTGAAPTPAHFPRHSAADVENMFVLGKELGSVAVFIYQWSQPDLLDVARTMTSKSRSAGLTPMVAISPTVLGGLRSEYDAPKAVREKAGKRKLSFDDKDVRDPYIDTVVQLARMKPPYLCLATEINMMAFADIKEYIRFAAVYKRLYRVVKDISPDTKVFVSFQWDFYRLLDRKEPKKIEEHSKLIDIFRPELDVVAFTSYPSTQVDKPSSLSAAYYSDLNSHVKKSDDVIFMEIGWPTTGKGSETSQVEFINALPRLMENVRPKVLAWSLLHDVPGALAADLATTGLLTSDGRRKPGFEAFTRLGER